MQSDILQSKILIYTRQPYLEYTTSLSNSIHFAYCEDNGGFKPLNGNYGILFAEADINEKNVIQEKGLINPCLFATPDGTFGITAIRVASEGREDAESKGQILLWTSKDLISFQCHGLITLKEKIFVREQQCRYNYGKEAYEIRWKGEDGTCYRNYLTNLSDTSSISAAALTEPFAIEHPKTSLERIIPGNVLEVEISVGRAFYSRWELLHNVEMKVPERVLVSSKEQLESITATAVYSDGSAAEKKVSWNCGTVNFSVPGTYCVSGEVVQETYPFPIASGYADPVILNWNEKYYYLATNDNRDDIGMFVREGNSVAELFAPGFTEAVILDVDEEKDFIQTFWAPEFHVIGGELYILFAVGGKIWAPQCHIMKLKKGGNIMRREDWEEPIRVRRADGSFLAEDGITLDMTYFKADGVSCLVWSYRHGIGTPLDTGSMLYIAAIDEKNPSVLISEPVLLTRPLYGWENIQGTINNEGPYSLVTENTVYITYSAGSASRYTYALGLLSIPRGSNYLDAGAWLKATTPVLSYYTAGGVYGPGHNSFYKDANGNLMILYHGVSGVDNPGPRSTAMHRVHWNKSGIPVFNLSEERDVAPGLKRVETEIIVSL